MPADLNALLLCILLSIFLDVLPVMGRGPAGLKWGLGNRDAPYPDAPWIERARRAGENSNRNLIFFGLLVLVVHAVGRHGGLSDAGAVAYLVGRIGHAATYIAGIPVIRTLFYALCLAGVGMVAAAALGIG